MKKRTASSVATWHELSTPDNGDGGCQDTGPVCVAAHGRPAGGDTALDLNNEKDNVYQVPGGGESQMEQVGKPGSEDRRGMSQGTVSGVGRVL